MAFLGVHNNPNLEDNYKLFAECGFNISLNYFGDYENDKNTSLKEACEMANKYGISIIANTHDIHTNPKKMAEQLKDQKGFYGYYIIDEPTVEQMKVWSPIINQILEVDKDHAIYMNLLPNYNKEVAKKAGAKDYADYLEKAKMLNTSQVSFDFYPILKSDIQTAERMKAWYKNLQEIADYSKSLGKDFWGFILSVPHSRYPQPTIEHFRIQAYTNLAYGAQGIEYFTYQTPTDGTFDFHDGPIEKDYETRTKTWYLVKKMNRELKKILPVFLSAKDFKVVETSCVLIYNKIKKQDLPNGVDKLLVSGCHGAIMSTFNNNGKEYLMVVNKSYKKDVTVTIDTDSYVPLDKELNITEVNGKYNLPAGDMLLFVKK